MGRYLLRDLGPGALSPSTSSLVRLTLALNDTPNAPHWTGVDSVTAGNMRRKRRRGSENGRRIVGWLLFKAFLLVLDFCVGAR
jgi:hypothetical protein